MWVIGAIVLYIIIGALIASSLPGSDDVRVGFLCFFLFFGGFVGALLEGKAKKKDLVFLIVVVFICLLFFLYSLIS